MWGRKGIWRLHPQRVTNVGLRWHASAATVPTSGQRLVLITRDPDSHLISRGRVCPTCLPDSCRDRCKSKPAKCRANVYDVVPAFSRLRDAPCFPGVDSAGRHADPGRKSAASWPAPPWIRVGTRGFQTAPYPLSSPSSLWPYRQPDRLAGVSSIKSAFFPLIALASTCLFTAAHCIGLPL